LRAAVVKQQPTYEFKIAGWGGEIFREIFVSGSNGGEKTGRSYGIGAAPRFAPGVCDARVLGQATGGGLGGRGGKSTGEACGLVGAAFAVPGGELRVGA
jgi:hypothetical protein